jgi:hypothetical protein
MVFRAFLINVSKTVAESNFADRIISDKNVFTSKWWLERSQKDRHSAFKKTLPTYSEDETKQINVQIIDYKKYYKPTLEKAEYS